MNRQTDKQTDRWMKGQRWTLTDRQTKWTVLDRWTDKQSDISNSKM